MNEMATNETVTAVETKKTSATLVVGIVLIVIGMVAFLAANFRWPVWIGPWKLVLVVWFVAMGGYRLARYFSYTRDEAIQGVGRRGGLVSGSFWIFLGIAILGDALRWFSGWQFVGNFWPLVLVLIGLAKVWDFYRLGGRAQFRSREFFGVLLIVILGTTILRAPHLNLDLPENLSDLTGIDWNKILQGPSVSFTEEKRFPVAPSQVTIFNRFGNVRVTRGLSNEIAVRLEKVIYEEDQKRAREIADRIQLLAEGTEPFNLRVNRQELDTRKNPYKTHLEVQVPAKTEVVIDSAYGSVDAVDLTSACTISAAYGPVRVENVTGRVDVRARREQVSVERVTGDVKADVQHSTLTLTDIQGNIEAIGNHRSMRLQNIRGTVRIQMKHGFVDAADLSKDVVVDASNSKVELRNVKGTCEVRSSHREIRLEGVAGKVKLDSSYSDVNMNDLQAEVAVEARHGSIRASNLRKGIVVKADGTHVGLDNVEGPVQISTSLRDVEVSSFKGQLDISSRNGNVRLTNDDALAGAVNVTNENGDIVLRLSQSAKATLDLQSSAGSISNELSSNVRVAESGSDATLKGPLNGGGPQVKLQTRHSSIHLERTKQ